MREQLARGIVLSTAKRKASQAVAVAIAITIEVGAPKFRPTY